MKKQNKQKLKNIWNKIKRPLMILSIVGNVLFIMAIIVGCASMKKTKAQQTNAVDIGEVYDLFDTTWYLNDVINYTPMGKDFLSYPLSNPETWMYDITFEAFDAYENNFRDYNTLYFHSSSNSGYQYNWFDVQYRDIDDGNEVLYRGSLAVFDTRASSGLEPIFYYMPLEDDQMDEIRTIHVTSHYTLLNNYAEHNQLFYWFFENASLIDKPSSFTFTFNKQINYNAPQNASLESPFVLHSFSGNEAVYTISYNLPSFMSNGEVFDTIKIWYFKGYSMRYLDGTIQVNDNQGTAYYNYMEYIDSTLGTTVMVNYRNFVNGNVEGSVQTYLTNGSEWVNENYRVLIFNTELTPNQTTHLSQFNNQNFNNNGFSAIGEDVGVGNVFSLMGSAFAGLTALWSIQLLPNITLGLLLFMPLIVIVIITIIKLVKR